MLKRAIPRSRSIYIHYPFCQLLCPYCDFPKFRSDSTDALTDVDLTNLYSKELKSYSSLINEEKTGSTPITSIYFGGGTPSLATSKLLSSTINNIEKYFKVDSNVEITIGRVAVHYQCLKKLCPIRRRLRTL
jgi:oxygen-independent coproporphyrinogen-3 oxidase